MADEPGFGDTPSFISDVQFTHSISPDKKAITIVFSSFTAKLVPNGQPVLMRTLSMVLPLKNVPAGAKLTGGLQGGGVMHEGTGGMLIFRAGGVSHVFDPLFGPGETTGFVKPISLVVPAAGDVRMTIVLALEGSATNANAEADITVTSVDLLIGPPEDIHV